MTHIQKLQSFGAKGLAASLLAASGLSVCLSAQESPPQERPSLVKPSDQPARDFTSTSEMIAAPVFLAPIGEEKPAKAEIVDVLIDCYTGEWTHSIISVGGVLGIGDKTLLVPASQLKWNGGDSHYELGWTAEEVERRLPFDLSKASAEGLDKACGFRVIGAAEEAVVAGADTEKIEKTEKVVAEAAFVPFPSRLVRGSELSTLPIYAGSDEFGKSRDLIIDRKDRKVVLAVVNQGATLGVGGTDYLIAFPHLSPCNKDDAAVLCATKCTTADLQASVQYHKPEQGVIEPAEAEKAIKRATSTKDDDS